MPLLNLARLFRTGNAGEVTRLDARIGNSTIGQIVSIHGTENPIQTVSVRDRDHDPTIRDMMDAGQDVWGILAGEGRTFYASDADQDDKLTGQTSFANTTPTLFLRVPVGTVAIPGLVALGQSGTVAGDAITVIIEIDNEDRLNTGGTSETRFNARTGGAQLPTAQCTVLSTATATAG